MNFIAKSAALEKEQSMFKRYLGLLKRKFIYYDYCSLTWAIRTFVASLICLCVSYFWQTEALWLLTSGTISVQLYAYSERGVTRLMIFSLSILLGILSAWAAYFSHWPLVETFIITAAIFLAFFIAYKGTKVAIFALWVMVFIIIAVCLPGTKQQLWHQLISYVFAAAIAYLTTFICIPRRRKDQPVELIKRSFQRMQRYMTDVFNRILTDEAQQQTLKSYEDVRFSLNKIRGLADPEMRLKFVVTAPDFSESVVEFSYLFAKIFHLLVSIDRLELSVLPADVKLKFEYLNVAFQSLIYLLHQALSEKHEQQSNNQRIRWSKTSEIIQFTLYETRNLLEAKNLSVSHCLKIASFYYLLEKLSAEFQQISTLLAHKEFHKELQLWRQ